MIKCSYNKLVPVDEVFENPENEKIHPYNDELVKRLAKVISYQGLRKPIVVSKLSGLIVCGHATLAALKLLDWKEIPVDHQDFENEDQELAHLIADNATNTWREIDLGVVNTMLPEFDGMDFPDIDLLGIEDFTIDISEKNIKEKETKPKICPSCGYEL
jgi:hypothetical protein